LISTGRDSQSNALIKLFDVENEEVVNSFNAHTDDINSVTFINNRTDGALFASGSDDTIIKLWDARALGINAKP